MAFVLSRRIAISKSVANTHSFSGCSQFFSDRAAGLFGNEREYSATSRIHLSPLFMDNDAGLKDCKIEHVDDETWRVSSGLKDAWIANEKLEVFKTRPLFHGQDDDGGIQVVNSVTLNANEHDFDDIEDMRIHQKKGEKSEGKVQIVLKSIADGGIDVKVKPKETNSKKGRIFGLRTRDQK